MMSPLFSKYSPNINSEDLKKQNIQINKNLKAIWPISYKQMDADLENIVILD